MIADFYVGDVVETIGSHRAVIRAISGEWASIVDESGFRWMALVDLHWTGEIIRRLPRTGYGWRKLGQRIGKTL